MAVICFRKESIWVRREAAACVGRGHAGRQEKTEERKEASYDTVQWEIFPRVKFHLV